MVRNWGKMAALAGLGLALSGCGSTSIFDRDRPDEFAVSRQAPLVIPPDFALVPPAPGAPRPQATSASDQALEALFGGPQPRSMIERTLTDRAGNRDPGIRSSVGDPGTDTRDKGTVTRDIVAAPEGDGENARAAIPQ